MSAFLKGWPSSGETRWRLVRTHANGQLALGKCLWDEAKETYVPHGINVLTLRDTRIGEITAFLTSEDFGRFGLPHEIQP